MLFQVRRTRIDRMNPWGGKTMGAFCCDKPTVVDGMVFFAFQKAGLQNTFYKYRRITEFGQG